MIMNEDQKNRVYEYRNHVANISYQRMNFFLVFESVLLGAFGILYTQSSHSIPLLAIVAILGFCITIAWGYAQIMLAVRLERLTEWTKELIPEYKAIMEKAPKEIFPYFSWRIITHGVPSLVLLIWIVLMLFTVYSH